MPTCARNTRAGTRFLPADSGRHASPSQPVLYRVDGGVAFVCLNRPAVHNALAPASVLALAAAWQSVALDRAVRVAVLHAEGESFCSGRDLRETGVGLGPRRAPRGVPDDAEDSWWSRPGEPRRAHYVPPPTLHKPVVAAVHGLALGGGLELALNCDIRIAADDARLGLPEATRGVVPGSGGMYWLPRMVGPGLAMELLLTGRTVDAAEALAMRLVNRVVPRSDVLAEATRIARRIAELPPLAVQAVKETVWRTMGAGVEEGLRVGEHQNRVLGLTEDAAEGARAFDEKRAPVYTGR